MIIGKVVINIHAQELHEELFRNLEDGYMRDEEELVWQIRNATEMHIENLLGHGMFYISVELQEGEE